MQTIFAVGEGNKQYLVNPYLDFEVESGAVTIIGARRNSPLPFPDSGIGLEKNRDSGTLNALLSCFGVQ